MTSILSGLYLYVLAVIVMLLPAVRCNCAHCGAYLPGDIVIGILGSVHSNVKDLEERTRPEAYNCTDFDLIPFVESLAVIHTIETINNSSFLPGIKLGYVMCDPCVYGTKALDCVENILAFNRSSTGSSDYEFMSPVKAFIGERYSDVSIPVAKLLSLYMIPQISCTSSSPALSDKLRYASFLRVIPSDIYQTQVLAKFMKKFSWNWIGVVTLDDDYGKPALENFLENAKEQSICVNFKEVLPNYLVLKDMELHIKKVAETIRKSNATVVLLILRPELVEMLFKELIKTNTSRVWIASDAWSLTRFLMEMPDINKVGDIFGLTFISGNIPDFKEYLKSLRSSPESRNDYISEYKQMRFGCTPGQMSEITSPLACNITDPQQANDDYLVQRVDLTEVYSQRVAVYAIAHAIKQLLNCNSTVCSEDAHFHPWKLLSVLHTINFTVDNQTHSFNKNGDFENGYNLIMWKTNGDVKKPAVVGKYLIQSGVMEVYKEQITWFNSTEPTSRCSDPCPTGTHKQISQQETCCYSCAFCDAGQYSDQPDQLSCQQCPNTTSSLPNSTECKPLKVWFLQWNEPLHIVVMTATVLGILLLLFSLSLFVLYRKNPKISTNLLIYCLMKVGLLVSFVSIILFFGDPSDHHCRAQQILYGLGFTFCVSCVLVRSFKPFLQVMSNNPYRQRILKRFDKPFIILVCLTVVQAIICISWFISDPPKVKETRSITQELTINRLCTQGSNIGFGAMHIYIAALALVCFMFGFIGQDNESALSMLFHLFIWLCFIPIYITQNEHYAIVQISAIMIFNYGVISCHLVPKWYRIILMQVEKLKEKCSSYTDSGETLQDSRSGSEVSIQTLRMRTQTQLVSADAENME